MSALSRILRKAEGGKTYLNGIFGAARERENCGFSATFLKCV
jgi:hypothetical protein